MNLLRFVMTFVAILSIGTEAKAQRIDWIRARSISEWENILQLAGNTQMGLFVQVCSDWSQICLNMNNVVLRDRELVREINRRFIPVQIDGDSDFGQLWIRHYALPGYPVHLFIDAAENILIRLYGAQDRETILASIGRASTLLTLYPQLQNGYISGSLSARGFNELIRIEVDNHDLEAARPIFKDYISKFGSNLLEDTAGLQWISLFGLDVDDPFFDTIERNFKIISKHTAFNAQSFFDASLNISLQRAVRDSSEEQLERILQRLIPLSSSPEKISKIRLQTRKLFYFDTNNPEKFLETLREEYKDSTNASRRAAYLEVATELMDSRTDPQWGKVTVQIMQDVLSIRDDMNARIGLAGALTLAREYDEAVRQLNIARQMTNDSMFRSEIDNMIQRVRRIQLENRP
ncbi:MAG: hypothetical protein ACK4KT_04605 [Thermaurantimonas sp.]